MPPRDPASTQLVNSAPMRAGRLRWPGRSFWLVGVLFGWMFSGILFADNNLVFRDGGHFFHPLLQYVRQSWYAGEIPLWNPYENLGEPLAASSTSLVFYPGSILLLLPIAYDWAFKLFIVAHLMLAAWGAALLARNCGRSSAAATFAALAYAGGGQVSFQHVNAVFLISSAWLPFAWLAIDSLVTKRSPRAMVGLGLAWALMFFGRRPPVGIQLGACIAAAGVATSKAKKRRANLVAPFGAQPCNTVIRSGLSCAGFGGRAGVAPLLAIEAERPRRQRRPAEYLSSNRVCPERQS